MKNHYFGGSEELKFVQMTVYCILHRKEHTQVFAESRLFEAPEWCSHISLVVRVHKDSPSLQVVTHIQSLRKMQ